MVSPICWTLTQYFGSIVSNGVQNRQKWQLCKKQRILSYIVQQNSQNRVRGLNSDSTLALQPAAVEVVAASLTCHSLFPKLPSICRKTIGFRLCQNHIRRTTRAAGDLNLALQASPQLFPKHSGHGLVGTRLLALGVGRLPAFAE